MAKMWSAFVIVIIVNLLGLSRCSLFGYRHSVGDVASYQEGTGDPGEPLFLTSYVESGNLTWGRKLARVQFTEALGAKSYAGYFTVNKTYDANQFFWYFPALTNPDDAPVILWLQGGPGASSLYGLFTENGPIRAKKGQFERRKYTWALNHHVIYIDNPVGTGFSFTKDPKGYVTDETQVGRDLYSTLIQFFKLFPNLQQHKFYVTGESYAGKYVPAIAYTIHQMNQHADLKINMIGVAIGNGLSDPEHQLVYSSYLYQLGLLDTNQMTLFKEYESKCIKFIQAQKYEQAFDIFDMLLNGDVTPYKSYFHNVTGFEFYFNYLHTKPNKDDDDFAKLLQFAQVRKDIHVGKLPFNDGHLVEQHLKQDVMKSVAPWISELLNHYYVVLYNGQLDIIVAYPLTVNYLKQLPYSSADLYKTAKRYVWRVDGEVAGYVKTAGNLTEILVRNAGHMVPHDQPKWALDLITRFTHEKTFF